MSFVSKKASGKDYPYFRAGGEGQYYLGRPEKPNIQNILKSLDYVKDKSTHYFEVEDKLIAMLPEPERKEYLSKRTAELLARLRLLEEELQTEKIVTDITISQTSTNMGFITKTAAASKLFTDDELKKIKQAKKILDKKTKNRSENE